LVDHQLHRLGEDDPHEDSVALRLFDVPEGVHVYDVKGPFFFGAVGKFQAATSGTACRVIVLRMLHVSMMDATGVNAMEELLRRTEKDNTTILITGIQPQPHAVMRKYGLFDKIRADNVHETIVEALLHAADIVEEELHQTNKTADGG